MFGFSLFRTYAGRPSRFQIFCLKGAAAAEVHGAACSPQGTRGYTGAESGNPAFRRPSISRFAFGGPPRAIHAEIVKAGSVSSRRAAASRRHVQGAQKQTRDRGKLADRRGSDAGWGASRRVPVAIFLLRGPAQRWPGGHRTLRHGHYLDPHIHRCEQFQQSPELRIDPAPEGFVKLVSTKAGFARKSLNILSSKNMVQRLRNTFQIIFRKGNSKIGSDHVRPIPESLL